ncbi:hypothetical protein N657DRAFT_43275 [Parathielavia appendiculata]|uniref:Uncharacterized protein n=1 Tax=Parathielavia appendiculata TaxID=2587402 RepID=A0AAN6U9H1_9PEZI|nr:hypothetical protein N657DRAFT_43275 [Parathielavia appendiculata]
MICSTPSVPDFGKNLGAGRRIRVVDLDMLCPADLQLATPAVPVTSINQIAIAARIRTLITARKPCQPGWRVNPTGLETACNAQVPRWILLPMNMTQAIQPIQDTEHHLKRGCLVYTTSRICRCAFGPQQPDGRKQAAYKQRRSPQGAESPS